MRKKGGMVENCVIQIAPLTHFLFVSTKNITYNRMSRYVRYKHIQTFTIQSLSHCRWIDIERYLAYMHTHKTIAYLLLLMRHFSLFFWIILTPGRHTQPFNLIPSHRIQLYWIGKSRGL